jgi:hypothetical protein
MEKKNWWLGGSAKTITRGIVVACCSCFLVCAAALLTQTAYANSFLGASVSTSCLSQNCPENVFGFDAAVTDGNRTTTRSQGTSSRSGSYLLVTSTAVTIDRVTVVPGTMTGSVTYRIRTSQTDPSSGNPPVWREGGNITQTWSPFVPVSIFIPLQQGTAIRMTQLIITDAPSEVVIAEIEGHYGLTPNTVCGIAAGVPTTTHPLSSQSVVDLCRLGTPRAPIREERTTYFDWVCSDPSFNPPLIACEAPRIPISNTSVVTPSAGSNGSISPNTPQTVNRTQVTFIATPDAGYVTTWGGTCVRSPVITDTNTFLTLPIASNCTVTATFSRVVSNSVCGPAAGRIALTLPPIADLCQSATSLLGPGAFLNGFIREYEWGCLPQTGAEVYCSAPIPSNYKIAQIAIASNARNGRITTQFVQAVAPGSTATFVAVPDAGYGTNFDVGTCGGSISGNTFTTSQISEDCRASVGFLPRVNGTCGPAATTSTATAPTGATNLCAAGMATTVTGTAPGPWSWACNGLNSGTNASCTAPAGALAQLRISQGGVPISTVTAYGDGHTGAVDSTVFERLGALAVDCTVGSCPFTVSSDKSWLRIGVETATGNVTMGQTGSGSTPRGVFYEIDPTTSASNETASLTFTLGTQTKTIQVVRNGLTDSDGDAVADEWERRGIPLSNSNRELLPNANVGKKNLWFWIDEMAGLSGGVQLKSAAIEKFKKSFERQGYVVTVVRSTDRGYSKLPTTIPVIDMESRKRADNSTEFSLTDAELTSNIDALKASNFFRVTPNGAFSNQRDSVFRYILWGGKYSQRNFDGTNITSSSSGIAPWLQNLAFVASEYGCNSLTGCLFSEALFDEQSQSGTMFHEVGHTLGLGHGGPLVDMAVRLAFPNTSSYNANENLKPNHISVMNYAYQLLGLVTSKRNEFQLDYALQKRPTINENSLNNFWINPVQNENGTHDKEYGIRFACRKIGENNLQPSVQVGDFALKEVAAGAATSCTTLDRKPNVADLDHDGEASMIEAHPEWVNVVLAMGSRFHDFDIAGASAQNIKQVIQGLSPEMKNQKEAPGKSLVIPVDYRHIVSADRLALNVLPSGNYDTYVKVSNVGFKPDSYTVMLADIEGITASPVTSIAVAPGGSATVKITIVVSSRTLSRKLSVIAQSNAMAQNRDSIDLSVTVVQASSDVSVPQPSFQRDTTNQFSFTASSNVTPDTYVESGSVTLTGFDVPLPIQVRGGEMSINGGGWTQYISTVNPGDILRLRTVSSTVAGEKRTVEVAVGGLVRAFDVTTSLDTDGDGIPDAVETAGPNNGDANGDGIPDSTQPNIGTIFSPAGNGYVTFEVSGGCSVAQAISIYTEAQMASQDANYAYPLGLLGFRLPCTAATVKLYYHGVTTLSGYTFRRYGPTTPGNLATTAWSNVPNVTTGTKVINGATVATATYSLTDGQPGDDTATDGVIVDPVGPALYVGGPVDANGVPVPVNDRSGLIVLMSMIALAGGFAYRRRTRRIA